MNNIYMEQYLKHHTNFIDQLKIIFPSEETIKVLTEINESDSNDKLVRVQLFSSLLTGDNFDMFIKNKIKVFSHKSPDTQAISESLFGPAFCIKNLLNNQPEEVKKVIWIELQTLCMIGELLKPEELVDNSKVKVLSQLIYASKNVPIEETQLNTVVPPAQAKLSNLEDMLGVQVNEETKIMIQDIVQSFEKVLTNQTSANPLGGIMEIGQQISTKYADKINKGEIELDKIMGSITKTIPGMEDMLGGMMGGMMGGTKNTKPKEKIIIDDNFSTANIDVGSTNTDDSKSFDIGGILRMADKIGVIPGGKELSGNSTNPPDNFSKMFEFIGKLDKAQNKEDAETLKQEMDSFLQKELGVDISALNAQLDQVIQTQTKESEKPDN
jgi:hypothetical protein